MGIGNYGKSADASPRSEVGVPASGGSFTKPEPEPEVVTKDKPPTPASSLVDALERGFERDVNELEGVIAPIKPYKERLADEGITLAQARHVLDALLLNGSFYAEDVKIAPSLTVRFRTRQFVDTMRTYSAIEREAPRFASTTDQIQLRYMLAASLEAYGNKAFVFPESTDMGVLDDAFNKRLAFIYTLSDFAVQVLAREFAKFDRKVALILSDGAVEAF